MRSLALSKVCGWAVAATAASSLLSPHLTPADVPEPARRLTRIGGDYDAYVHAEGLRSPDGLAFHPLSGELYIAEEDSGQIIVIRDGQKIVAVDHDWRVDARLPKWAITKERPRPYWLNRNLRSPEGIAFSPNGHLFVTEDVPDGRLMEFIPDETGHFATARPIPIPWLDIKFSWEGIAVASDGRLFLAGSAAEAGPGLFFGVVLMRDRNSDWWVVDYGPFAGFSSVSLSREQDILIVGEEIGGSVTWWDTLRHRAIGTVTRTFPNLEDAAVLPDGALAIVQESSRYEPTQSNDTGVGPGGGRIFRVNPKDGDTRVMASGFGTIECMAVDPATGYLYVTEDSSGSVIELRPKESVPIGEYLLKNTVRVSEMAAGLPPKKWPPFLRGFFRDLGVNPRDEVVRRAEQGHAKGLPNSYTLVEVGDAVPLVAGKVRTQPTSANVGSDPIAELDFIILFPNRAVHIGDMATPGLSFFSAKRASGKVERTRSLDNMKAFRFSSLTGWTPHSDNASLYLPIASCSVRPTENGMDIAVAFLTMGEKEDYYLHLSCGKENTGHLVVDGKDGMSARYGVDFEEETLDGAAFNTIVVAGFNDSGSEKPGWLNIGNWPLGYSVSPEDTIPWTPHSALAGNQALMGIWSPSTLGSKGTH